jgi:beta-lactamase regulating signal transducer with metallopeptidase domain
MQAIAIESLQGLIGRLIGLGLMHGLWISVCTASAVALWFQIRPRLLHQSRHRILVIAFLLVAAAPIVVTGLHRAIASRRMSNAMTSSMITVLVRAGELDESRPHSGEKTVTAVMTGSPTSSRLRAILSAALAESVDVVHRLQPFLVVAWTAGVFACTGVVTLGTIAVHRMCCEGRPAEERIRRRANQLARFAGLKTPPRVIVHPRACEPFLCGLLPPVILLPEAWLAGCRRDLLDAILAHELAHARRRDHLVNVAQRLVEIALFFSPAVHWLSRSLRRQREFCADAFAVQLTGNPAALAAALESVARIRLSSPASVAPGAALGGQTISLLPRIQELLGMMPSRPRPHVWPLAALPAAGLMALVVAASGLSQDQPAATTAGPPAEKNKYDAVRQLPTESALSHASEHKDPLIGSTQAASDRQISYKVRGFDRNTEERFDAFKDRLKPVKHGPNVRAWIVDQKALDELIEYLGQEHSRQFLDAPKVAAFEEKTVTITMRAGDRAMRRYVTGSVVKVTGLILSGCTKLTVGVRLLPLEEIAGPERKKQTIDINFSDAAILTNVADDGLRRVTCEIPDGSSLVISLSLEQRKDRAAEMSGWAQNQTVPPAKDRLFLITPKSIVLEGEQERVGIPPIKGGFDRGMR